MSSENRRKKYTIEVWQEPGEETWRSSLKGADFYPMRWSGLSLYDSVDVPGQLVQRMEGREWPGDAVGDEMARFLGDRGPDEGDEA